MKQLVILSGKGGTGKTSVAAAFAHLAHEGPSPLRAVLADADVDAANLELVLHPRKLETHAFTGGSVAEINPQLCQSCGTCESVCRFDAVRPPSFPNRLRNWASEKASESYTIDPIACDGCAACVYQCPEGAIRMQPQQAGYWFRSESRYGPLFHAELHPAQENSGKLVTMVKQQARLLGLDEDRQVMIVDGPPGIGCPVISAAAGADLALVVTEPTAAGIHDMQRALQMSAYFRLPALVCINKADLYPPGSAQIEKYCLEAGIPIAGQIPFDETMNEAMAYGEPVTAYCPGSPAGQALVRLWQEVAGELNGSLRKP